MNCWIGVATALMAMPLNAQTTGHETEIRQILSNETTSWNKGDAVSYSRDFAKNGTFTNIQGQFFTGYDAFLKQHEYIFSGIFKGTTVQQEIVSLRFLNANVAVVETLTAVGDIAHPPPGMLLDDTGHLRTRLLQVVEKENGHWKVVVYHNVAINPKAPPPFNK